MRKLLRELKRTFPDARITTTGRGHYRLRLPGGQVVIASATPSDRRSMRNTRAEVRRQSRDCDEGGRI
jgi:hypothetical protein